jgi:hypothetical protein
MIVKRAIPLGFVFLYLCAPRLAADDAIFNGSDPLTIGLIFGEPLADARDASISVLCVAGGGLYFAAHRNPTIADAPMGADIPKLDDTSLWNDFHRVGKTIRVDIPEDRRGQMKKSAAKDGWFLTADYSAKPPRVVLTKEEGKYSHWLFVHINNPPIGGNDSNCFVRNENDLGKPAWLAIEKGGVFRETRLSTFILRKPILSFDTKTKFDIGNPDDGK